MQMGADWLKRSATGDVFSRFHAEAGIAAEHCFAPSFEHTRWKEIADLYAMLERIGCVSAALLPHPLARVAGLAFVSIGVHAFYVAPWRAGSRVLDVACGAGYPALAAAREVQPGGRVVATDLSRQMLDVAAERARAEGLRHLEFVERDGEDLQFHNDSFDAVTNAYGLMFCPEPLRAIAEARRVLVPGGGIALVTWDLPSHSPFFAAFLGVAAGFFTLLDPGPNEPNPFRLASADVLRSMLDQTGFSSIDIERLPMTFECDSAFDYCRIFMDYGWQSRIAAVPPEERDRFYEAVAEATRPYADEGRLRLAASSLCACARK